jgi:hypothetical protein
LTAELEGGWEQAAGHALGAKVDGGGALARVLGEERLGVKHVDMRRAAGLEQEDDVLRFGREVRTAGSGGLGLAGAKEVGEAEEAETTAYGLEERPSG